MINILIAVGAILLVGGIITWQIVRKIQGKSSGCCDCSSCSSKCHCKSEKSSDDTNK